MSTAAYYRTVVLFLYITCYTRSVIGQFSSPNYVSDLHYVREFATVEIPWKYSGYNDKIYAITWSYRSSPTGKFKDIYQVNGADVAREVTDNHFGSNRVKYIGSIAKKDATLAIIYLKKDDEGEFKCAVIGLKAFSKTITLKVIVLSNVTEFKADDDDIMQGDNVSLSCNVTSGQSRPSPKIEIVKGRKVINSSVAMETGSTTLKYYFSVISEKDKGRYLCQVTTDGYTSKKDYDLKVKYPPKIDKSMKEQYECKDTMVTLKCNADGNPKPNIRLIGPGDKAIDKNPFQLKTFGKYRCVATNSLGNDSHVITVKAKRDPPKIDKSMKEQYECKDTMVTLKCNADGNPKPNIRLIGPRDKVIDKNPFQLKTFGKYQCVATNSLGNDSHVITVKAKRVIDQFSSPNYVSDLHYVREFATVEIPWKYSGYNDKIYAITWSYRSSSTGKFKDIYKVNGTDVAREITDNHFGSNRVKYIGSIAKKDATLAITYLKKDDEGEFKCDVVGIKSFFKTITLKVIVLSNVTEFKADDDDIMQGDNVSLSCNVTSGQSRPSPKIEILKGRKVINSSVAMETGSTTLKYYFSVISEKDKGRYLCQVTTDGYTSKKDYDLKVKYPPKIDKSMKEQYECKDTMVTLKCNADGNPKPNIRLIGPGDKAIDKNPFQLKKFGKYRCVATNSLGNDSHVITVTAKRDKPEKPLFDGKCLFSGLAWTKSKDSNVKFTLQVKEGDKAPWNDVITLSDTSYSPSANESFSDQKTYEFKVIATNCVGSTESTGECLIEGKSPSSGKRSSNNAGAIAGSVIAALILILTVVVIAVIIIKKRRQDSAEGRSDGESRPMTDKSHDTSKPKVARSHKDDELLSDYASNGEDGAQPSNNSQQPGYAEIDHDGTSAPTHSNNIPSWV